MFYALAEYATSSEATSSSLLTIVVYLMGSLVADVHADLDFIRASTAFVCIIAIQSRGPMATHLTTIAFVLMNRSKDSSSPLIRYATASMQQ